jgi:hypothetical protein
VNGFMYPRPVRPSARLAALSLLAALAALAAPRPAAACATAPPPGTFAQIAEESAIVVWDDKTRTEHFIRRAAFRASGPDFGFLVPTPTKPELAEVPNEAFTALEAAIDPGYVTETRLTLEPTALCALPFLIMRGEVATASAPASAVRILDAQRVGGYNAVVLEADNAEALATWLTAHNYATTPSLSAWLAPYIAAHWKITAFKIAKDEDMPAVATSAVRMSFTAEQPFFPYREPADQREAQPNAPVLQGNRLLRVFFIGPERVAGSIGAARAPWPGETYYSNPIAKITKPLALPVQAPEGAWLTVFEDRASPRPGTDDLFFARAADASPLLPKPRVQVIPKPIPLPLDVLAVSIFVIWRLVRWARKRAQA